MASAISLLASFIFLIMLINSGWNQTGQVLTVFTAFFGIFGIGGLWKPETIGQIVFQLFRNADTVDNSDSHNKQSQKGNHGVQAMATQGGKIVIKTSDSAGKKSKN